MKLTSLGANITEIETGTNTILFSYKTPVAFKDINGNVFVTEKRWSVTTSKHIGKWLAQWNLKRKDVGEVSQEKLDAMTLEA